MKTKIIILFLQVICLCKIFGDEKILFHQDYKYGEPIIYVNINEKVFEFIFDTGASSCCFSKKGIIKFFGSSEAYTKFKKPYEKQLSQYDDACLSLNIAKCKVEENFIFNNKIFLCNDKAELKYDGIIGYSFFDNFENIVINYIEKCIYVNQSPINEFPLELNFDEEFLFLEIPIFINGKQALAYIDTGFSSENDKLFLVGNDINLVSTGRLNNVPLYNVELQFSNTVLQIDAVKHYEGAAKFHWNENLRNILKDKNILGNAVFENKILQFDFQNKLFRINDPNEK